MLWQSYDALKKLEAEVARLQGEVMAWTENFLREQKECHAAVLELFSFEPGDHILFRLGSGPFAALEKALLGSPWGHIAIKGRGTLLIESIGRGVLRRDIRACSGSYVRVLRPRSTLLGAGLRICEAAERIADNPQSWYDYLAIVKYALPRLIAAKLHLPMPLKWHRNPYYVCSEFVEQADVDAGYPPECVPEGVIPLPGDFNDSPMLRWEWEGVLP